MTGLLGDARYTAGQMTYDLRRLRLAGLISRIEHTNHYVLTEDGIRIAVFYTKIYNRLLIPLTAADQPQAPPQLRAALKAITTCVDDYATRARLARPSWNLTQTSRTSRPKIVRPSVEQACSDHLGRRFTAVLIGDGRVRVKSSARAGGRLAGVTPPVVRCLWSVRAFGWVGWWRAARDADRFVGSEPVLQPGAGT
jgi:hypothetical protein